MPPPLDGLGAANQRHQQAGGFVIVLKILCAIRSIILDDNKKGARKASLLPRPFGSSILSALVRWSDHIPPRGENLLGARRTVGSGRHGRYRPALRVSASRHDDVGRGRLLRPLIWVDAEGVLDVS